MDRVIYENRMYWEAWAETSKSYTDLIESLTKRGYKDIIGSISNPILDLAEHNAYLLKEKLK